MLLVTFAVPHESRFFRRTTGANSVRVLHTGIGEDAARRALRASLDRERPSAVISCGFAGGLDPTLQVGDLIAESTVSAPELIKALPSTIRQGRIHTTAIAIDSPAAKSELRRETDALAVDMETSAIAAECAHSGVPLLVLRVISDAAEDEIPVPLDIAWNIRRQAPRPFRLAGYLARHPARIGPLISFLGKTNQAAKQLAGPLSDLAIKIHAKHCN